MIKDVSLYFFRNNGSNNQGKCGVCIVCFLV